MLHIIPHLKQWRNNMKSRQQIKVLKLIGVYDRRGKKYNDLSPLYYFKDCQNIRRITSHWYESEKSLKKFYSGRRLKIKKIIHMTD